MNILSIFFEIFYLVYILSSSFTRTICFIFFSCITFNWRDFTRINNFSWTNNIFSMFF